MNFLLQLPIPSFSITINYRQKFLLIGSCFAENIGEKIEQYKFNVIINPHGVLYNPASISVALHRYINNEMMKEEELFFANECWNSWEHHSRFSTDDKKNCLMKINKNISEAHVFLKEEEWLFITFGSAYTYKLKETGELIGNCHKIPQNKFIKSLLTIDSIVADYNVLLDELKTINPKLKIMLTVSPVRYIRDGIIENNRSKARLMEAVHQLVEQHSNVFYFPAYDLVIDELRDYRFYKTDLVHPNEQAIEYVFEKFKEVLFDEETKCLFEEIKEIISAKSHKPFRKNTNEYKKFKATYLERCLQLQSKYCFLNLLNEIIFFKE